MKKSYFRPLGNDNSGVPLFSFLLLVLVSSCCKPNCKSIFDKETNQYYFKCGKKRMDFVQNEILLNANLPNAELNRKYLDSLCFKKVDSCKCGRGIERWKINPPDGRPYDVGSSTNNGNTNTGGGFGRNGLFLNLLIENELPVPDTSSKLKNEGDEKFRSFTSNCNSSIKVKFLIIDSGIETAEFNSTSNNWGGNNNSPTWISIFDSNRCIPAINKFGINVVSIDSGNNFGEPQAAGYHGTVVNKCVNGDVYIMVDTFYYKYPNQYNRSYVNVNIFDSNKNSCTLFDALCGLSYAIDQKPDILNLSWGFMITRGVQEINSIDNAMDTIFRGLMQRALDSSILVVAAVGNSSTLLDNQTKAYPACMAEHFDNFISVGSVNVFQNRIKLAPYTNYSKSNGLNKNITINWIGDVVYIKDNNYYIGKGTSYAAPIVAKMAGLMKSVNPSLTPAQIKDRIVSSSIVINQGWRFQFPRILKPRSFRVLNQDYFNRCDFN